MAVTVLVKSSNQEIKGKVSEISGSAANTGGQYLVKINLENTDASILSGMFVNVQFPIEKAKNEKATTKSAMVLVPQSALVTKGQLTGIYTVNNEVAILRWIRTGKSFGNQVEVLSGLSADEKYIVSAEGKLYNGVKVSIK
jgi:multidrug efflux pump subunit AcrA (membrane-fusion protein)